MQEEQTSLDDILDDEPTEPIQEEPQEEPKGPARDETGRFAKKGDDDDGAPPAPKKDEYDGAATVAERRKRQDAEQRIADLERQLQAIQNPPAPPPTIWEDENAWQQNFGGQVASVAVQQASLNARLDMSEMMASQNHPDFDEKKAVFLELMQANPQLRETAMQDRHPWEKAYQIATNHATMQELSATSIDDLRAKIKAELMAEMGQPGRQLPPTLSGERNVGPRSGPQWSGPTSLDDLLR